MKRELLSRAISFFNYCAAEQNGRYPAKSTEFAGNFGIFVGWEFLTGSREFNLTRHNEEYWSTCQ